MVEGFERRSFVRISSIVTNKYTMEVRWDDDVLKREATYLKNQIGQTSGGNGLRTELMIVFVLYQDEE